MSIKQKLVSALTGLTLIIGLVIAPASAWADQTITTQPYYAASGIKALHAQGLDGSGIKIAIIDGPVDTSVPELRGVKVITKSFCTTKFAPSSVAHATALASILASPDYGWAPKATILNYTSATIYDEDGACNPAYTGNDLGFLINQALNDGADVISISIGTGLAGSAIAPYALIRAANLGVPIVASAGNDNKPIDSSDLAAANTVITVGAIDGTGKKASYSNYGTGLDLMAYGGPPMTIRDPDKAGHLSVIHQQATGGTSMATPMVAGALALAKQKWPNASGNQLERVLLDTADGAADHQGNWTEKKGYGTLNAKLLVGTDPSTYSDENPNLNKNEFSHPQAADFQAYADGTVDPNDTLGDNSYTYRGCNQAILNNLPDGAKAEPDPACQTNTPSPANPTPTTTTTPPPTPPNDTTTSIPWLPIGIAAGAVVIIAVIVIIVATTRRKHNAPPPVPVAPQAWQTPQQPYPPYPGGPPTGYPA